MNPDTDSQSRFTPASEYFLRKASRAQKAEAYLSLLRLGVVFRPLHDSRKELVESLIPEMGLNHTRRLVKAPRSFNEVLVRAKVETFGLSEDELRIQFFINMSKLLITTAARQDILEPGLYKISRRERTRIQKRLLKDLPKS